MNSRRFRRGSGNSANFERIDQTRNRGRTRPHNYRGNTRFQRHRDQQPFQSRYYHEESNNNEWNDGDAAHLDDDTRNYFFRVRDSLQTAFENKEEEEIFVTNVLAQTEGKEVLISCNKLGSQCLQRLLELTTTKPEAILKFTVEFGNDLPFICTHHFGSHVVESVLKASFRHIQQHRKENRNAEHDEENHPVCELKSWLLTMGQFCLDNLDDLLYNLYGSHVFSSLLQIFGDQNIDESVIRSKRSREYNKRSVNSETGEIVESQGIHKLEIDTEIEAPEDFSPMLKKIVKAFRQKDFHGLCMDQVASPVLQALLIVSSKSHPKLCQKVLKTIVQQAVSVAEEGKVPSFFGNKTSSHVMERVVTLADEKRKKLLWENLFQKHLKEISLDPIANFVLQRYHAVVENPETVEEILNEIGPCFEDIFSKHHFGVVASLGDTCKRLKTGQAFYTKSVMSALHCWEPEDRQAEIVPLLLRMTPYDEVTIVEGDQDQNSRVLNLHGSLILQHMLWFNKPHKITKSLFSMKLETLQSIVCDPKGSHIVDAFVQSTFIGESLRDKLIQLLKPVLAEIVCNKYGSRSLDSVWEAATLKQKRMIVEELCKKEKIVCRDHFGRFFAQKIGLSYFKHRRKDWEQAQTSSTKKRKLFEDIIGQM